MSDLMDKWISIKAGRLPKLETEVMTYDGIEVRAQFFSTSKGRYPNGKFLPTWYHPTHWQPMSNEKESV